jgi:hypothetical protein
MPDCGTCSPAGRSVHRRSQGIDHSVEHLQNIPLMLAVYPGEAMERLRRIPGFAIRLLIGAFLVAQLAGVVSERPAQARAIPNPLTSQFHHSHTHYPGTEEHEHHGAETDKFGGACCALHAFFAGVLPPVAIVDAPWHEGRLLEPGPARPGAGVPPVPLDRPPRPAC